MKANDPLSRPMEFSKKPWSDNANPVWLASTVTLARNIEKFKFPGKLDVERKKQIITLSGKELLSDATLVGPRLVKAEEMGPMDKEFVIEHFLSQINYGQAHQGEAFVIDESGEFLATLNIQDHLHMQMIDCKGELEATWSKLVKMESQISKKLNYAFSSKFGFLTADPTQCGTALAVSCYLQVPGLIHTETTDDILNQLNDDAIVVTGIQGSPSEIIGDILVLRNNYTLGVTEENIISSMRSFITKLLIEEKSARSRIKKEEDGIYKDKVSRAFAILMHSYQIDAVEALNALSLLKLGVETEWVSGITMKQINEIFFNCRRAHLLTQFSEKVAQEEIPHRRAEYIHKSLKEIRLMI